MKACKTVIKSILYSLMVTALVMSAPISAKANWDDKNGASSSYTASVTAVTSNGRSGHKGIYLALQDKVVSGVHPNLLTSTGKVVWTTDPGYYIYDYNYYANPNQDPFKTHRGTNGFDGDRGVVYGQNGLAAPFVHTGTPIGYHYYPGQYDEIYIAKWEYTVFNSCIHGNKAKWSPDANSGLESDDPGVTIPTTGDGVGWCWGHYPNGYLGYCADCGELSTMLIYSTYDTIQGIKNIPNGSFYYYFCPQSIENNSKLEMGNGNQCTSYQ